MRLIAVAGVLLILFGAFALTYQGINYVTQKELIDVGPLKAEVKDTKTIPLHPVLGALSLAAGVFLIAWGVQKPA